MGARKLKEELIWEGVLDGRVRCEVVRLSSRSGRLIVRDIATKQKLLVKIVPLAYGAQYGPDVADVDEWQRITEAVMGNPSIASDYLWSPKDWPAIRSAYALAARHYWRIKSAEIGHMNFDVETQADLASELTLISAMLSKEAEGPEVREWILNTGNAWLVEKASEAGVKVAFCEGDCHRVTAQNGKGKFLCVTCAAQADRKTAGGISG